jgi:hypothetical protein
MTVDLSRLDGLIIIQARAEGDEAIDDPTIALKPGESAPGKSHAEWSAMPDGPVPVDWAISSAEDDGA